MGQQSLDPQRATTGVSVLSGPRRRQHHSSGAGPRANRPPRSNTRSVACLRSAVSTLLRDAHTAWRPWSRSHQGSSRQDENLQERRYANQTEQIKSHHCCPDSCTYSCNSRKYLQVLMHSPNTLFCTSTFPLPFSVCFFLAVSINPRHEPVSLRLHTCSNAISSKESC